MTEQSTAETVAAAPREPAAAADEAEKAQDPSAATAAAADEAVAGYPWRGPGPACLLASVLQDASPRLRGRGSAH